MSDHTINVSVNGERYEREVEARKLLVHFIRDDLDLTGTHVGCDTGNCGACTVLLDGAAVKSCMLLAPQADGAEITTVEGLAGDDGELTPLQQAFHEHHGLQCGYCTPGDAAQRDLPPLAHAAAERGGDPPRDPGEHLPLHRLREHRQVDPGGERANDRDRRPRPRSSSRSATPPARASRARRTAGSSRARASSPTTSSGTGWATSTSSARRTRTPGSSRSTSPRPRRSTASTGR